MNSPGDLFLPAPPFDPPHEIRFVDLLGPRREGGPQRRARYEHWLERLPLWQLGMAWTCAHCDISAPGWSNDKWVARRFNCPACAGTGLVLDEASSRAALDRHLATLTTAIRVSSANVKQARQALGTPLSLFDEAST